MKKKIIKLWRRINSYHANRKYKDALFRYIFKEKQDLLDLYNAINGTSYENPEELIITTLKDVIYLGFKNDSSFILDCQLNLYEHQSTWNPNMPLRGFLYFADMIRSFIAEQELDIYANKRVMLPLPQYIVFYNGTDDQPDRQELKLSDSFEKKNPAENPIALECTAIVLNINYGHNRELMEKCRKLSDYAYFVQAVRIFLSDGYTLKDAVNLAVDECIHKDILADILRQNRAEVMNLILTYYDEKLHNKTLREEGREEGRREAERMTTLLRMLLEEGKNEEALRAIKEEDFREKLYEEYQL